ncbi:hypothetical protein C2857_000323 [Epichloe festucae Fl1]|uniref:Uncharacterized protein n=1 Tax=Epichloe festucae (strain Fl1) TaxID=877507 RepID=A0A7S9PTD2_EPIFF|nr:hypothetical protein C2857_000323 [Epichloe festucae Fl1]
MRFAPISVVFAVAATAAATNIPPNGAAVEQVQPAASCFWSGTSPFCAGACPEGYQDVETSNCGDGACCWTGYKKKCCK